MNIKEVKELIQDILHSDISEFELEHTGTKVRLRRGIAPGDGIAATVNGVSARGPDSNHHSQPPVIPQLSPATPIPEAGPSDDGLHLITSPIVGTFYRSPAPGADPYVRIGSKIETGTILCIVEAMKLMNEIPADVSGEIVEIYVENSQPVEYGQKLFGIRTRK
jgi:acetyl-CoA carboxylase biotin carboxyl carrier protein